MGERNPETVKIERLFKHTRKLWSIKQCDVGIRKNRSTNGYLKMKLSMYKNVTEEK